ncbi:MAG: hypothetical protein AAGU77_06850 [Bacillota bacterium]
MTMDIVQAGWALMGLGLVGVFTALVLIFLFSKLLLAVSRRRSGKSEN